MQWLLTLGILASSFAADPGASPSPTQSPTPSSNVSFSKASVVTTSAEKAESEAKPPVTTSAANAEADAKASPTKKAPLRPQPSYSAQESGEFSKTIKCLEKLEGIKAHPDKVFVLNPPYAPETYILRPYEVRKGPNRKPGFILYTGRKAYFYEFPADVERKTLTEFLFQVKVPELKPPYSFNLIYIHNPNHGKRNRTSYAILPERIYQIRRGSMPIAHYLRGFNREGSRIVDQYFQKGKIGLVMSEPDKYFWPVEGLDFTNHESRTLIKGDMDKAVSHAFSRFLHETAQRDEFPGGALRVPHAGKVVDALDGCSGPLADAERRKFVLFSLRIKKELQRGTRSNATIIITK